METLREDLETPRHPGDGGGTAWIEFSDPSGSRIAASEIGSWVLVYEAGPHGIAVDGVLFLQVSPFWGWSPAQNWQPMAPGFTTAETDAPGVELSSSSYDQGLFGIRIAGRDLEPGERIRIHYGAGSVGALSDRYAEAESRFWIAVDADGDGIRNLIADSPSAEVISAPPESLVAILPTTARPEDELRLTLALVDAVGNAGFPIATTIALRASPESVLDLPAEVHLEPGDLGRVTIELTARAAGSVTVEALASEGWTATSNPLTVADELPRVLWADLHGHSGLSDGTGTPHDYFVYARDVAALDVAALTDHDHWGMQALARYPALWDEIVDQTSSHNLPGRFVTVLGYEWTSWLHGHRHVLYFDDRGEVLSSVDPEYETPEQLWEALRGRQALTFAHHSAGGPIATNWAYPPDPVLEPLTEIVSVHGSSEAADSPGLIYSPVPGNFVRDVLDRGFELGFVGSGDSHDGHPGLSQIASGSGGIAAILSEALTRDGVLEALRARRTYATNGPRILLHASLEGSPIGSDVAPGDALLEVRIAGTAPLRSVDLIRSGAVAATIDGAGRADLLLAVPIADLRSGEYLYLRTVQVDGGAAWSSPWFVR